jgi:hypothetical protein
VMFRRRLATRLARDVVEPHLNPANLTLRIGREMNRIRSQLPAMIAPRRWIYDALDDELYSSAIPSRIEYAHAWFPIGQSAYISYYRMDPIEAQSAAVRQEVEIGQSLWDLLFFYLIRYSRRGNSLYYNVKDRSFTGNFQDIFVPWFAFYRWAMRNIGLYANMPVMRRPFIFGPRRQDHFAYYYDIRDVTLLPRHIAHLMYNSAYSKPGCGDTYRKVCEFVGAGHLPNVEEKRDPPVALDDTFIIYDSHSAVQREMVRVAGSSSVSYKLIDIRWPGRHRNVLLCANIDRTEYPIYVVNSSHAFRALPEAPEHNDV